MHTKELDKLYNPKTVEEKWSNYWLEKGLFKADADSKKPPFSMVIPPPNVTGSLHMGHALNNTLQDILARYKRMQGFDVLWLQRLPSVKLRLDLMCSGFTGQTMQALPHRMW